ncbi:short chain dehydrogenase [Pyronema domesticum]|uniref:Similar to Probable NADP-dependent mannitol dehydrogenase acc. no. O00058 n=1 Tax=Pyronema omphalodes (strain CBS 100304) TaxID=1076935 RepID=U4L779_PYROM|nr:short chain dehydrogenase [Pyronema domesticum]CCX13353.1 Similar to Probable NADP-dependent mannitol dehydrogenase; acc. no. O00058 [Pyronema omphalodes CBS 100304]
MHRCMISRTSLQTLRGMARRVNPTRTPFVIRPMSSESTKSAPPPTSNSTYHSLTDFDIRSKVILVTGGARGLGLTQSEALAQAGATVYALDLHDSAPSEFTKVSEKTPNMHYCKTDVRCPKTLESTCRGIADKEGRMDGMIASAGILDEVSSLEASKEQFQRVMDINVTGCFLSAQACAREMVRLGKKGGSILLVASMSGMIANRDVHMAAYNSSKGAVHQMARNLASEWGKEYGIRVNTLSPGYIMTDMVQQMFRKVPERKDLWSHQNMLGRLSTPAEYRGAAVFLMSDASSYMTGADLMMDGGHRAW